MLVLIGLAVLDAERRSEAEQFDNSGVQEQ